MTTFTLDVSSPLMGLLFADSRQTRPQSFEPVFRHRLPFHSRTCNAVSRIYQRQDWPTLKTRNPLGKCKSAHSATHLLCNTAMLPAIFEQNSASARRAPASPMCPADQ